MTLYGLPDFQASLGADGIQLFAPYGGGAHVLAADRLEVAQRADGQPDFMLELIRRDRLDDSLTYGVLDFRLRAAAPIDAALALLRPTDPAAMIRPAVFETGSLRLQAGVSDGISLAQAEPSRLDWNGLGVARSIIALSAANAVLIKRALGDEVLAITATAEMFVRGVAPRLALSVRFDAGALLQALLERADSQRRIARAEVLAYFSGDLRALPIELSTALADDLRRDFAATMTDRFLDRFAASIAPPDESIQPFVQLNPELQGGTLERGAGFEWDLAQPLAVLRAFVLQLDPLLAARQAVLQQGLDGVYHETSVPPLATGVLQIEVLANLPAERHNVLALGATISAPPRLPDRPQAAVATALISPPSDRTTVRIRLAPLESPEYRYSTFMMIRDSQGIRRIKSAERSHSGPWLHLAPDSFPVQFVLVQADEQLIDIATLRGVLRWSKDGMPAELAFTLDSARHSLALPLLPEAIGSQLEFKAQAIGSEKTLRLGPLPAVDTQLGLHSFPEYGPQMVEISCDFGEDAESLALDLLPEQQLDTDVSVVLFTRAAPARQWHYLARSPFAPGFRYRIHVGASASPGPWSAVCSPLERLTIRV